MPIPVKDYVWHETLSSVYITLPLNNCNRNKVDIFYTPHYIKVSYPPYFFEIFLPHKIWSALTINDLNEDAQSRSAGQEKSVEHENETRPK